MGCKKGSPWRLKENRFLLEALKLTSRYLPQLTNLCINDSYYVNAYSLFSTNLYNFLDRKLLVSISHFPFSICFFKQVFRPVKYWVINQTSLNMLKYFAIFCLIVFVLIGWFFKCEVTISENSCACVRRYYLYTEQTLTLKEMYFLVIYSDRCSSRRKKSFTFQFWL